MVEDRHYCKCVFWCPESSFWVHFVEIHSILLQNYKGNLMKNWELNLQCSCPFLVFNSWAHSASRENRKSENGNGRNGGKQMRTVVRTRVGNREIKCKWSLWVFYATTFQSLADHLCNNFSDHCMHKESSTA